MQVGDRRLILRLLGAEGISRLGDAVSMVALPLTAVLVLDVTPAGLALIGAAQALPILLLSLPAGAWVDRRPRRWPILLLADLSRAALLCAVPLAAALGFLSLPLLLLLAAGGSVAGTLFDVAFGGWVPRLLAGDRLHLANARIELARSGAAVGGPALGGALVALFSAPIALLADAASFVASAVLIATLRGREPASPPTERRGSLRADLLAGLTFVRHQPLLRAVMATAGINNLTRAIAMAVAVLYLVDVGRLSAAEIGLAFSLGYSGYLVGALASRRLTNRLGVGWVMQLGVGLFGPSMLLFAVAPPEWLALTFTFAVFANGFGIAIHNVNQVTVRQLLTPDELRARVAALTRLLIFGAIPIGTLIGGALAEAFGMRAAIAVGALGLFLGSLPYLFVRVAALRTIDQLTPAQASVSQ